MIGRTGLISFVVLLAIALLPRALSAPDCSTRPALITVNPSSSTTVLLDSIYTVYNTSWSPSMKASVNSYLNQIKNIIYGTSYSAPADKINAIIVVFKQYQVYNRTMQQVLFNVSIAGWGGAIQDFIDCGNATNTTQTTTPSLSTILSTASTAAASTPSSTPSTAASTAAATSTTSAPVTTASTASSTSPSTASSTTTVSTTSPTTVASTTALPSTIPSTPSTTASSTPVATSTVPSTVSTTPSTTTLATSTVSSSTSAATTPSTVASTSAATTPSTVASTSAATTPSTVASTTVAPTTESPTTTQSTAAPTTAAPTTIASTVGTTSAATTASTTLAPTTSTTTVATTTPSCQQPASTAGVLYSSSDPQISTDTQPTGSCGCTAGLVVDNFFSSVQSADFTTTTSAATAACSDFTKFCMGTESGEYFTASAAVANVIFYPYCDTACHMYAVVSDEFDGSVSLTGDQGTTFTSTVEMDSSTDSGFANLGTNSPFLKATSFSCDTCTSIKPAPTCSLPPA